MRILNGTCSEAACELLGWLSPLRPSIAAAQLVELGKTHPSPAAGLLQESTKERLAAAAGTLYQLLSSAGGSDEEQEGVAAVVTGAAIVWVEDGFVTVDRAAFAADVDCRCGGTITVLVAPSELHSEIVVVAAR
jgi:hypothetical protein